MPEKEVRLIDANALLEQVENEIYRHYNEYSGGYYLAEDAILDIKNAPTIAPESLRPKGKWEPCFEDWREQIVGDRCSVCGFSHYGTAINRYRYCPNCGAKMEG